MIEVTQTHGVTSDFVHIRASDVECQDFYVRLTRAEALDLARRIFKALDWDDGGCDCVKKVEAMLDEQMAAMHAGRMMQGYRRGLAAALAALKGEAS